jgi:hypothetical protein
MNTCVRACVRVCVRAYVCVRAGGRACVRACGRAGVRTYVRAQQVSLTGLSPIDLSVGETNRTNRGWSSK